MLHAWCVVCLHSKLLVSSTVLRKIVSTREMRRGKCQKALCEPKSRFSLDARLYIPGCHTASLILYEVGFQFAYQKRTSHIHSSLDCTSEHCSVVCMH